MSNTADYGKRPRRALRHKHLRNASNATVVMALAGFPLALALYAWATTSCWGAGEKFGLCEIFSSLPWLGLALSLAAYFFVLWIIHEMGHELAEERPVHRNGWQQAKQGYKHLDQGHHRMVRRVHRVSSIALAGLAAYVSFQYFEADTLANITVACIAYLLGELLNWKKYNNINY
jgi:hypothetical protein